MQDLKGKVAVVTGGASGIGKAMADRFAAEGMKIVIADVQQDALDRAKADLEGRGAEVLAVLCDVSKLEKVEDLARQTVARFGGVHVLCNNAGVASAGAAWERSHADWEWVMGVNLWAVVHGVRVFVPLMLASGEECHVVNTASMAGLITAPGMSIYNVTKFGVVSLSECLFHELKMRNAKVGVSVLCPAWVQTGIVDSERNRPAEFANPESMKPGQDAKMLEAMVRQLVTHGQTPEKIAGDVLNAVKTRKFYILTHPEFKALVKTRMEDILEERDPTFKAMM